MRYISEMGNTDSVADEHSQIQCTIIHKYIKNREKRKRREKKEKKKKYRRSRNNKCLIVLFGKWRPEGNSNA